jgi:hypothetical protein
LKTQDPHPNDKHENSITDKANGKAQFKDRFDETEYNRWSETLQNLGKAKN